MRAGTGWSELVRLQRQLRDGEPQVRHPWPPPVE